MWEKSFAHRLVYDCSYTLYIKIFRVIVARAKSGERLDDQLRPLLVDKYYLPLFTLFRPLCPAFSFADVDIIMCLAFTIFARKIVGPIVI